MSDNSVTTITPQRAYEKMQQGAAVLDVREYPEWSQSHVRGAKLIPLGDIKHDPQRGNLAPEVLILCRSGRRAAEAAQILSSAGIANPQVIEGGILQWQAEGLPVISADNVPMSIERQVRIGAGSLVLLGLLVKPLRFISWFAACGLIFAGITDWCGMAKVLSKCPWNQPHDDQAQ